MIPAINIITPQKTQPDYWIIASQACNIYNQDFEKIPLIELVGGKHLASRDPGKSKGENPRILHVLALSEKQGISIELDILVRHWIPRAMLARIDDSPLRLRKTAIDDPKGREVDWGDLFVTWLSRSYTRVALPDEFNDGLRKSKIEKIIDAKLISRSKDIYGIYFSISSDSDSDEASTLPIGQLPPPYLLGIVLIFEEHADGHEILKQFISQLFEENQTDPKSSEGKISRVELAKRLGIRIIREDIEAKSITEVTLYELKHLVRFSMSDHLSSSSETIY